MILSLVFYTKPSTTTRSLYDTFYGEKYLGDVYYGNEQIWIQRICRIFKIYLKESVDRNVYGTELFDYVSDGNTSFVATCQIIAHPKRRVFFESLEYYSNERDVLLYRFAEIAIIYSDKVSYNKLTFKCGLYENEIILIDEPYGE